MANYLFTVLLCWFGPQIALTQMSIPGIGRLPTIAETFCNGEMPKPWPTSKIEPSFWVYSRKANSTFKITELTDAQPRIRELDNAGFFAAGRQIVFIIHGFLNNQRFSWLNALKDAILKEEDSTVFVVSWGNGAFTPSYPQAGSNTQTVAQVIKSLSDAIATSRAFKTPDQLYLYCIGHSLGAQICGQAGRLSKRFNRVTGLDPAGPGFEDCWKHLHLFTDSAKCVDNVHTDGTRNSDPNGGKTMIPHYGTLNPWGHVDFYPNAGKQQTGCGFWGNSVGCSHSKAVSFFTYSVNNRGKCSANGTCADSRSLPASCKTNQNQEFGYYSSCHRSSAAVQPGLFHLPMNAKGPYCDILPESEEEDDNTYDDTLAAVLGFWE